MNHKLPNCEKIGLMRLLGIAIMIAATVFIFVIRFQNPDMTETRLLINFWDKWLIIMCSMGVGYYLIIKD